jgi:phytoene synthase
MRRALVAAGITSRHLAEGYQLCRRLNAAHGKTYYLATLLLPPAKRPYVHALYGFARYADDIVDGFGADRASRFEAWCAEFLADLELGTSTDPVCRAVIDTIGRWDIRHSYFADFLGAMRADLTASSYQTHDDLAAYMWGSAAVIGLEMLPILGRADDSIGRGVLEPYAVDLGIAFQLTNFLRDIAEDLARGRVYLPQESLSRFGVDRDRLRRAIRAGAPDEPLRNLLAAEIARTRDLYLRAVPGIELVHPTSRDCLRTAVVLYSRILDEIEAADYNVFRGRVTVPITRRAGVAARGLVGAIVARHHDQAPPKQQGSAAPWRSRTPGPR